MKSKNHFGEFVALNIKQVRLDCGVEISLNNKCLSSLSLFPFNAIV
ncbi:14531_t:CDS:2 [Entrophospora sp. SA101]|nr:14531_t:CDS:2 [Entrophospora sp. SA101]